MWKRVKYSAVGKHCRQSSSNNNTALMLALFLISTRYRMFFSTCFQVVGEPKQKSCGGSDRSGKFRLGPHFSLSLKPSQWKWCPWKCSCSHLLWRWSNHIRFSHPEDISILLMAHHLQSKIIHQEIIFSLQEDLNHILTRWFISLQKKTNLTIHIYWPVLVLPVTIHSLSTLLTSHARSKLAHYGSPRFIRSCCFHGLAAFAPRPKYLTCLMFCWSLSTWVLLVLHIQ